MGIKKLSQFIKKNYIHCIENISFSELKYKTLCIDSPCLMYKYKYSCLDLDFDWCSNLINLLIELINAKINLCFVLEGESPKEKLKEQENRLKCRQIGLNKLKKVQEFKELYISQSENNLELIEMWKNFSKDQLNIENINILIHKLKNNYETQIKSEDWEIFKTILQIFNVTFIKAENEAETTCSYLQAVGKVDYIFSSDTDILAYKNTNGFINNIDISNKIFSFINKKKLLKEMEFNEDMFIDFCILCGTDYNITIPKIGIVRSKELILKFNNLENCNFHKHFDDLKVLFLRNLFNLIYFKDINICYAWSKVQGEEIFNFIKTKKLKIADYVTNKILRDIENRNKIFEHLFFEL